MNYPPDIVDLIHDHLEESMQHAERALRAAQRAVFWSSIVIFVGSLNVIVTVVLLACRLGWEWCP